MESRYINGQKRTTIKKRINRMIAFSRIKDSIACAIIIGEILGWCIMLIPDYGREIYNNTAPVDYDEYTDQTGFPAGKGYEVLTSRKAIVENEKNYIIKIDTSDLESTNLYKAIGRSKYYTSKFAKYDRGNLKGGVGTFYIAKLENGDKILVLIDDRTVTIPKSGAVELPVASTKSVDTMELADKLEEITGLTEDELTYYVDTTEAWRKSEAGEKIEDRAIIIGGSVWVSVAIILSILFAYIEKMEEKKQGE